MLTLVILACVGGAAGSTTLDDFESYSDDEQFPGNWSDYSGTVSNSAIFRAESGDDGTMSPQEGSLYGYSTDTSDEGLVAEYSESGKYQPTENGEYVTAYIGETGNGNGFGFGIGNSTHVYAVLGSGNTDWFNTNGDTWSDTSTDGGGPHEVKFTFNGDGTYDLNIAGTSQGTFSAKHNMNRITHFYICSSNRPTSHYNCYIKSANSRGTGHANDMLVDDLRASTWESENSAPSINSSSISPDPPLIGKNVSASFNVSDSDGNVSEVLVEVFENGSEVANRTQSYSSSSVSDTFSDLYNINDANYTFYYTATDNDGAQSVTTIERQAEEPDSKPPNISYNPDTTDSGKYSQSWIFANYSASDNKNISQVLSELDNSNITVTNLANGNYWINHTSLSDGSYSLQGWVNDTAGNWNSTPARSITLDTTPPTTSDNYSKSGWQDLSEVSVELSANDSASSVANITYSVDGGAETTATGNATSLTVSGDGNHSVTYYAYDAKGNKEAAKTEYILLDDTAPGAVNIRSPENVTYEDQTTIDLDATGSDATSGIGTWYYSKDGGSYQQFTPNTSLNYTEGQHTIEVKAQDRASNNASTSVSFYVNLTMADGYVRTLPPGKAVSLRSDPSQNLSKFSNAVEGVQDIAFGDGLGSNLSAQLRINVSKANVTADNLVFNTNRSKAKSVVHNTSSVANLKQKSLLIPRIENTGKVHICPGAENLSSIGLNCSNGYNISSGETVNKVSLSEASISGQKYYEAEGINGTGGVEVAAASSSGGGGGGSGSPDDSFQNASVVFSTPRLELLPGTKVSETARITNRESEKNTVDVSVPDTPSCKPVKLREGLNTGGFAQKASYTLEPNQTVSTAVQVAMPQNASTGFECALDVEASQGKAGKFRVVVEKESNPLTFLDNGWPIRFCRDVSLDTLETGKCENEAVEKFTVGHALLIGFLSAAAVFLYRVT